MTNQPNDYGYFDDPAREYVITRPDTPLPWLNYLGQDEFFGLCTNTAGGYTFWKDAKLRRLTRYRYNNVPYDLESWLETDQSQRCGLRVPSWFGLYQNHWNTR